jgi:hypothetical protein
MRNIWLLVAGFTLLLNLFQTWQYSFRWIIHPDRMTAKYYFRVFGKTQLSPEDLKLLMVERSATDKEYLKNESDYFRKIVKVFDYEKPDDSYNAWLCDTIAHSGKYSLKLDSTYIYSPAFRRSFDELTAKEYAWLRLTVWVYPLFDPKENPSSLVASFEHKGGSYKYRALDIEKPPLQLEMGKWNKVTMDYMTPEVRSGKDEMLVYFWHRGKLPVLIDDLSIEQFEK